MEKNLIKSILAEYQNRPFHSLTPAEFAEVVTLDTLPLLLIRLANECEPGGDYQNGILKIAAETLNMSPEELRWTFREYQKKGDREEKRFRFLSIGELYAMTGPTDWLVKSYLDRGSLAMIYGKSATLKSFAAIDMGLSVASGNAWHGNPVSRGKVFYICGEGQKGIARRLRAWELYHEIGIEKSLFFVSNQPAEFLDQSSAKEVVAAVNDLYDQNGKPVLVIIDTLNRNFGPGDESSTADMSAFIHTIDRLLRIPYGCTVLIIHHTGHTEQNRARGSYALHAALDWEFQTIKHDTTLELINMKAKDYDLLPPLFLKSEIVTLDWEEEDGQPMTSLALKSTTDNVKNKEPLSRAARIAYDVLMEAVRKNGGGPVHDRVWRSAAYEAGISESDTPDSRQKAFVRAKASLQGRGMIETKNNSWMPIPDTGQK